MATLRGIAEVLVMRDFKRRIIDGVINKIIVEIILRSLTPILIIAVGAITYRYTDIPKEIWLALIFCFAAIIALSIAPWFRMNRYPPFKWNFTHESNLYKMTFQNSENLEYNRYLNVKPLCANITEFSEGEYIWSGSGSQAELISTDEFTLELCKKEQNSPVQKYIVKANNPLQQNKVYKYGLKIMLQDANHTMKCENYIFIKRPTKKIRLELHAPASVRMKNVSQKAWSMYGDQKPFEDKKINAVETGGEEYKNRSYSYTVSRPKLFCIYAITWEWD